MSENKDYRDEIDVLMRQDVDKYRKLPALGPLFRVAMIEDTTEKAALVSCGEGATFVGWLPKSQLRTDGDGDLYLANWLYDKTFEE